MRPREDELRAIQGEFLSSLPTKLEELETARSAATSSDAATEQLRELHRLCHTLSGDSATLGFSRLSKAADRVEQRLRDILEQGSEPGAAVYQELAKLLDAVRLASEQSARASMPPLPASLLAREEVTDARRADSTLLVVEDDVDAARSLRDLLSHFGYRVHVAHDLDQARDTLCSVEPAVMIMDIVLPEGPLSGIEFVAELEQEGDSRPRVIFTSSRSDFTARLSAMRAGGAAYFTKPIDINNLVERIDTLTGHSFDAPLQILIVDDDPLQARLHAEILRSAGLEISILTDPLATLEHLRESPSPDLILLDVYMPECTGPELAAVLRQHERFFSIPIVFLSAEDDLDRQVDALNVGGDEFLTKPVDARHLLATVIPRAQRGRALGSLVYQDGLTGLTGHTKHKEQVETAVANARTRQGTLSYAMLDIDNFKAINDQFGHARGDRVLRSLARSLRSRLRRSDTIGRCGGDEFGVILPGTQRTDAEAVMESVRAAFAQVEHRNADAVFHATISIGISTFPEHGTSEELIEAADQALYEAKHQGRNRVVALD